MNTSINSFSETNERAIFLSDSKGEMNEVMQIKPLFTINFATSPTLLIFSTRSAAVKPKSLLSPCLILSPSRVMVCFPNACNFFSKIFAMEDFPEPDNPVNHIIFGVCDFCSALDSLETSIFCQ